MTGAASTPSAVEQIEENVKALGNPTFGEDELREIDALTA